MSHFTSKADRFIQLAGNDEFVTELRNIANSFSELLLLYLFCQIMFPLLLYVPLMSAELRSILKHLRMLLILMEIRSSCLRDVLKSSLPCWRPVRVPHCNGCVVAADFTSHAIQKETGMRVAVFANRLSRLLSYPRIYFASQ
jgi:hypothetical protein